MDNVAQVIRSFAAMHSPKEAECKADKLVMLYTKFTEVEQTKKPPHKSSSTFCGVKQLQYCRMVGPEKVCAVTRGHGTKIGWVGGGGPHLLQVACISSVSHVAVNNTFMPQIICAVTRLTIVYH